MKTQQITKGKESFNNGFNLKSEVKRELEQRGIEVKSIRHYTESPYQKNRYKPEYVGQEVWVKGKNAPKAAVITQDDYEGFKESGKLDDLFLMFD